MIEGDGDRFLVVRVPPAVELNDPEEIRVARDAAAEYLGPRYRADEALDQLRGRWPRNIVLLDGHFSGRCTGRRHHAGYGRRR